MSISRFHPDPRTPASAAVCRRTTEVAGNGTGIEPRQCRSKATTRLAAATTMRRQMGICHPGPCAAATTLMKLRTHVRGRCGEPLVAPPESAADRGLLNLTEFPIPRTFGSQRSQDRALPGWSNSWRLFRARPSCDVAAISLPTSFSQPDYGTPAVNPELQDPGTQDGPR